MHLLQQPNGFLNRWSLSSSKQGFLKLVACKEGSALLDPEDAVAKLGLKDGDAWKGCGVDMGLKLCVLFSVFLFK